jgi:DNA-binding CsgD family transcriptional regulator
MSFMPASMTSSAPLSALELEILDLLASGHTVKTIAASLGRSEAAINERLRDARRKTGIGSSRELARVIAAQKNRDKKIDLSPGAATGDRLDEPRTAGLARSKGIALMIGFFATAAAVALVASGPSEPSASSAVPAAAATSPLLGNWALDVNRIPANERPKSVTMSFSSPGGSAWNGKVEVIAPDGSVQHAESAATIDGPPVSLTGNMPFADSVSVRQPAPNTLVMTFEKGGKQVMTRIYTLEGNGDAMKETLVWAGDESPRTVNTFWHRIG